LCQLFYHYHKNCFCMRTSKFAVLVVLLAASQAVFAQTKSSNPWNFVPETTLANKSQSRQITPRQYRTLSLSVPQMKSLLSQAPLWHTQAAESQAVVISLPMPDGSFQDFRIVEAPIMHPDLQSKYPALRSYAGQGIDDPLAYFRGDFTTKGFHGMVSSPENSTVYIDPYSTADMQHYQVYYRKDFYKSDPWQCDFDGIDHPKVSGPTPPLFVPIGDCQLRDYTLALACTGEYANFHGATGTNKAPALAAMTTSMTRVNGVFERDASVHMTLHPNTDLLIYTNPSTDPYTNTNGSTMLGQNQTTCDNVIGNANYDIGHVFSTGGGGVAYLGCLCNTSNKAGGVTGQANPVGDPFDIDYVAHEMGHQYGANHTQNNNCNRNSSTAMEPGSASTIMGYAGICSPNVQNNSDDYFHAISLQEMAAELTSNGGGGGNTCSSNTTINSVPTADAGPDYVIPKSTPYILTGVGTDPNPGDVLTYTWEQMDATVATMPPVATATGGPAFRSFKGTTSPSRYLPRLQDVVNNVNPTWEVLASVGRTLNWRLVVRDNHFDPNTFQVGGCAAQDNMVVTVNGTAGPFVVTAPNTNVSWAAGSSQTVTWNVAGTTAAPVSCANVDIFLSVGGDFTNIYTLATATPNDGTQTVTIPNIAPNTTSRIMVKANGNIFYDISNTDFAITTATNGFTVNATPGSQSVCAGTNAVYAVAVGVSGSYSGNVTLSVTGLPAGANGSFSVNPVAAPGNSNLTVTTAGVAAGTYNLTINGTDGTQNQSTAVSLTVLAGAPGQAVLSTPTNGATGVSQTPTLTWNAVTGATTYDVQVSTVSNFATTVVNATGVTGTSYNVSPALATNTTYYWRTRAINSCGTGAWAAAFSFTTANTSCTTLASTDVPKVISASGTPTVTSTLNVTSTGIITDLNVLNLGITHTWINDLVVKLKSPAGTEITLFSQICAGEDNVLTNFDDAGSPYNTLPCPPTNNGTYQPLNALSAFNGQEMNGVWTLTVTDVANQDGGSLNSWSLNICSSGGGGGCNSQTINSEGFESGWGIWTDGGTDCARINNASFANTGTYSIQLRDNTSTSVMSTTNQNLAGYNQITVNFSYITGNFSTGEDFWAQISTNGGSTYTTVEDWVAGTDFSNGQRKSGTVTINGPFTSTTRIRFRCDASTDADVVYIDDVVITGCLNFTGDPSEEARTIVDDAKPVAANHLLAYPNPTSDQLTVEFSQSEGTATLVVTDMVGKLLQTHKLESNGTGLQQTTLNVGQLLPGSYLLQVIDGKERRYLQFVRI
jgi:subtilisin-like proprotein convertase family protein